MMPSLLRFREYVEAAKLARHRAESPARQCALCARGGDNPFSFGGRISAV
jgi:hypothetical protein